MLERNGEQPQLQLGHWPRTRDASLPAPQHPMPSPQGQGAAPALRSWRRWDPQSMGCDAVGVRNGARLTGNYIFPNRAALEVVLYPSVSTSMLGGRRHQPGSTSGCSPAMCPPSWTTSPCAGGVTAELLRCVGNTNTATSSFSVAKPPPETPQPSKENTRPTMEYAARALKAERLLIEFDKYRRSVSALSFASPPQRLELRLDTPKASGAAADVSAQCYPDVDALRQQNTSLGSASDRVHKGRGRIHDVHAAQLSLASPSPPLTPSLDPEAFEFVRRRALQMLDYNAHARAAYAIQGTRLSRAVYNDVAERPGVAGKNTASLGAQSPRLTTIWSMPNDGQAPPSGVMAAGTRMAPHSAASPLLARDGELTESQSPVGAPVVAVAASMPPMSEAEATKEAERALSLLRTIRAFRRQTEELTVSLLHACGEWGCWSTPVADEDPATDTTRRQSCPSSRSQGTSHQRYLFTDLFLVPPAVSTPLRKPPPRSRIGDREKPPHPHLPAYGAMVVDGAAAAPDTARLGGATMAFDESSSRRERACRVLRQALEWQQQRLQLAASPAAAAFLEIALTPPQRAVPPPPPMSVQVDMFAVQQNALKSSLVQWRERAALAASASAGRLSGTPLTQGLSPPYSCLQRRWCLLGAQRRQLQRTYDILHAAAAEGHAGPTVSHTNCHLEVQGDEAEAEAVAVAEDSAGAVQRVELPPPPPPSPPSSRPLAVTPNVRHHTSSSLRRNHSSPEVYRDPQAIASSDDTLSTSPVPLAVEHTHMWEKSTISEEAEMASRPQRGVPPLCTATATSTNENSQQTKACTSAQGTLRSSPGKASSRPTKGKTSLAVPRAVEVFLEHLNGGNAADGTSPIIRKQVTDALNTLFSLSSSVTAKACCGADGVLPDACEASWQSYMNAALSTHPDAARAVVAAEQRRMTKYQLRHKGEASDSPEYTVFAEMDDAEPHHLTSWVSQQRGHNGSGEGAPSSSPLLSQEDLGAAAAWLRSVSSPSTRGKTTDALLLLPPPPPGVVLALKHIISHAAAPSCRSVVAASATTAVVTDVDLPCGDGEHATSQHPQQPHPHPLPPSSTTTSAAPSSHFSSATSSVLEAATGALQSPPHAAADDVLKAHSLTASPESPEEILSEGDKAPVAPPELPAPPPLHPRLVAKNRSQRPSSSPSSPPLPSRTRAEGGGSAEQREVSSRQRRRGFLRRFFSCIG